MRFWIWTYLTYQWETRESKVLTPTEDVIGKFWTEVVGKESSVVTTNLFLRWWVEGWMRSERRGSNSDDLVDVSWRRVVRKIKLFKAVGPECIRDQAVFDWTQVHCKVISVAWFDDRKVCDLVRSPITPSCSKDNRGQWQVSCLHWGVMPHWKTLQLDTANGEIQTCLTLAWWGF